MEPTEEQRKQGILKSQEHEHSHPTHIKWDEDVIKEHDKDRGTRQIIGDPKTPYRADSDVEMEDEPVEIQGEPEVVKHVEKEIQEHLKEAEKNKELNAHLEKEHHSDHHVMLQQVADKLEQPDEKQKHEDFKQKMKDHYKGEANAAVLLKAKMDDTDDA